MESTSELIQDDSLGKVSMPPEMKRRRALAADDPFQWQPDQKCDHNKYSDRLGLQPIDIGAATPQKKRRLIIRSSKTDDDGADDVSTGEPVSELCECTNESFAPHGLELAVSQPDCAGTPILESDVGDVSSASTSSAHGPVGTGDWTTMLSACHRARDIVRAGGREACLSEESILKAQLLACRLLQGSSLWPAEEDFEVLSATAARAALESMGGRAASRGALADLEVDEMMLSIFLVQLSHGPTRKVALDHTAEFIDLLLSQPPLVEKFRQSRLCVEAFSDDPSGGHLKSVLDQAAASFVIDGAMNPAMGRLDCRVSAAAGVALAALFVLRRHGVELSADELPDLLCRASGMDLWSLRLGAELTIQVFRQWKLAQHSR